LTDVSFLCIGTKQIAFMGSRRRRRRELCEEEEDDDEQTIV